jgi:hypothetical protein
MAPQGVLGLRPASAVHLGSDTDRECPPLAAAGRLELLGLIVARELAQGFRQGPGELLELSQRQLGVRQQRLLGARQRRLKPPPRSLSTQPLLNGQRAVLFRCRLGHLALARLLHEIREDPSLSCDGVLLDLGLLLSSEAMHSGLQGRQLFDVCQPPPVLRNALCQRLHLLNDVCRPAVLMPLTDALPPLQPRPLEVGPVNAIRIFEVLGGCIRWTCFDSFDSACDATPRLSRVPMALELTLEDVQL